MFSKKLLKIINTGTATVNEIKNNLIFDSKVNNSFQPTHSKDTLKIPDFQNKNSTIENSLPFSVYDSKGESFNKSKEISKHFSTEPMLKSS